MSPEVFAIFKKLVAQHITPGPVLEIGATADTTLANLPEWNHHFEFISINADAASCNDTIIHMSSHQLSAFEDNYFSMVLCNSVWEHDLYFWKSLAEMTRVCQPKGTLILGVPSFGLMGDWQSRLGYKKLLLKLLFPKYLSATSLTLGLHHYPDDFYRFSKSAIKSLLQDEWRVLEQIDCMQPPRVITCAQKK